MIFRYLLIFILALSLTSCSSRAKLRKKTRPSSKKELTQVYTLIEQSSYCGNKPIVRFANFSYNKKDSLNISIDITTSISESKAEGSLSILLDEIEVEYYDPPTTKMYAETLEIEEQSRNRYPNGFGSNSLLLNQLLRSANKTTRKRSEKQFWNSLNLSIEPDDVALISSSSDIVFALKTKKCELLIYPSLNQVKDLKAFLQIQQ